MSKLSEADQYLLKQVRDASPEAWSQLVDRYQGRLHAFARAQMRNAADAEDVVQETFVAFMQGLSRFREQAGLETYLFSILRRKLIDSYRSQNVKVCALGGPNSDDGSRPSAGADDFTGRDQTASWYMRRGEDDALLQRLLDAALGDLVSSLKQTLNFRDLKVAELVFYAQARNKDIASLLKLPQQQIALLKHRFLKRISQHVAQCTSSQVNQVADAAQQAIQTHHALLTKVWEQQRPSCPKRSTIGSFLLGTLDTAWHDYVDFHLHVLGCRFCRANLDDLRHESAAGDAEIRHRILQSTVGFLRRS